MSIEVAFRNSWVGVISTLMEIFFGGGGNGEWGGGRVRGRDLDLDRDLGS